MVLSLDRALNGCCSLKAILIAGGWRSGWKPHLANMSRVFDHFSCFRSCNRDVVLTFYNQILKGGATRYAARRRVWHARTHGPLYIM